MGKLFHGVLVHRISKGLFSTMDNQGYHKVIILLLGTNVEGCDVQVSDNQN